MSRTFGWLDVTRIGEELADRHPGVDPFSVRFVELKKMVMALPGFQEEPGHAVNEKILESIQAAWSGERGEEDDE